MNTTQISRLRRGVEEWTNIQEAIRSTLITLNTELKKHSTQLSALEHSTTQRLDALEKSIKERRIQPSTAAPRSMEGSSFQRLQKLEERIALLESGPISDSPTKHRKPLPSIDAKELQALHHKVEEAQKALKQRPTLESVRLALSRKADAAMLAKVAGEKVERAYVETKLLELQATCDGFALATEGAAPLVRSDELDIKLRAKADRSSLDLAVRHAKVDLRQSMDDMRKELMDMMESKANAEEVNSTLSKIAVDMNLCVMELEDKATREEIQHYCRRDPSPPRPALPSDLEERLTHLETITTQTVTRAEMSASVATLRTLMGKMTREREVELAAMANAPLPPPNPVEHVDPRLVRAVSERMGAPEFASVLERLAEEVRTRASQTEVAQLSRGLARVESMTLHSATESSSGREALDGQIQECIAQVDALALQLQRWNRTTAGQLGSVSSFAEEVQKAVEDRMESIKEWLSAKASVADVERLRIDTGRLGQQLVTTAREMSEATGQRWQEMREESMRLEARLNELRSHKAMGDPSEQLRLAVKALAATVERKADREELHDVATGFLKEIQVLKGE